MKNRFKSAALAAIGVVCYALAAFELRPADVIAELERRAGMSGLEEFAARRAERGPSPGSFDRSWIRRSISGPAGWLAISLQTIPAWARRPHR